MTQQILLTGIAALFLATGTANARYPSTFLECRKAFIRIDHRKNTAPDHTKSLSENIRRDYKVFGA
jgi:hypothetical protein